MKAFAYFIVCVGLILFVWDIWAMHNVVGISLDAPAGGKIDEANWRYMKRVSAIQSVEKPVLLISSLLCLSGVLTLTRLRVKQNPPG